MPGWPADAPDEQLRLATLEPAPDPPTASGLGEQPGAALGVSHLLLGGNPPEQTRGIGGQAVGACLRTKPGVHGVMALVGVSRTPEPLSQARSSLVLLPGPAARDLYAEQLGERVDGKTANRCGLTSLTVG